MRGSVRVVRRRESTERESPVTAKNHLLAGLCVLVMALGGCSMTGGGDEGGGGGAVAKNVDAVHMRNGDVLVGELALRTLDLKSETLKDAKLELRHVESLEVMGDSRVKVRTRYGDIVTGSLGLSTVRLRSKTGQDHEIQLAQVDRIRFAE